MRSDHGWTQPSEARQLSALRDPKGEAKRRQMDTDGEGLF
jgi:hypothetical protein